MIRLRQSYAGPTGPALYCEAQRAKQYHLFNNALPFARPHIAGWNPGDIVMFPDPKSPTLERRGRVIASLPHFTALVLRAERPDAIVEINPARCRKVI